MCVCVCVCACVKERESFLCVFVSKLVFYAQSTGNVCVCSGV